MFSKELIVSTTSLNENTDKSSRGLLCIRACLYMKTWCGRLLGKWRGLYWHHYFLSFIRSHVDMQIYLATYLALDAKFWVGKRYYYCWRKKWIDQNWYRFEWKIGYFIVLSNIKQLDKLSMPLYKMHSEPNHKIFTFARMT